MKEIKWIGELILITVILFIASRLVHLIGADSFLRFIIGFSINVLLVVGFLFFAIYRLTASANRRLMSKWSFLIFKFDKKDWWLVLLLVIANGVFYNVIMKLEFVHIFNSQKLLGRPEFGGLQAIILIFLIFVYIVAVGFSEELYFRLYLFESQFDKFKSQTWIINGLAWSFFHIPTPTNFIALLPTCFLYSYVYQNRRNIWVLIIAHLITNLIVMMPAIRISINKI